LGYGCAETSMLRNQFINNNKGVAMRNYNALDMFIWYSFFQNNAESVTNYPGAGNFHVYNSIFENSTSEDLHIGNTGTFNIRDNYSTGSAMFLLAEANSATANITIEGNTILDTTNVESVYNGNLGPVVLLDNVFRSKSGATAGPVVHVGWIAP